MPKNHKVYGDWPSARFVNWAKRIGPYIRALTGGNLASAQVPTQMYSRRMEILKLGRAYGQNTVERACQIALE